MTDVDATPVPERGFDPYASPCIRNCTLDPSDICVGCGRTLDEILEWSQASPPRKRTIRSAAEHRLSERAASYRSLQGEA